MRYLFENRQLLYAATELETKAREEGWSPGLENKYNNIDKEMTSIMLASKNGCAPSINTKYPWSKDLKEPGLRFRFWN